MQHPDYPCGPSSARLPWLLVLAAFSILFSGPAPASVKREEMRRFNLPAGGAEQSLKRFSEATGIDVLFPTDAVEGIRTQAVRGRMTPDEALARMLARSGLRAMRDETTGGITVTRTHAPDPTGASRPAWQPGWTVERGTVSGQVSNRGTGFFLEGARIEIEEAHRAITTGRGGIFRVDLAPGNYSFEVSYTGLLPVRFHAFVEAGTTVVRDVALTSEIYALEEYTVSGEREGSALAIALQRRAPNLRNVVAIDHFGRPASNPADLVRRLPGVVGEVTGSEVRSISIRGAPPMLNSTRVDGNRTADAGSATLNRSMQYQHLGTYNIETIELVKTPTPDMDADSIGGTVNLLTKSSFDRPAGRHITYSAGTTYRYWKQADPHLKDRIGLNQISLAYSEIFGPQQNFGIVFNIGYRTPVVHVDEIYHEYQGGVPTPGTPRFQHTFSHRDFTSNERRLSGGLRLDYRIGDHSHVYLANSFTTRSEYMKIRRFFWNTHPSGRAVVPGYSLQYTEALATADSTVTLQSVSLDKHGASLTLNPGAVHTFGAWTIDHDAFYSVSETRYPNSDFFEAYLSGVGASIDRRGRPDWFPSWTQLDGPDAYDLDQYTRNLLMTSTQRADHEILGAKVNVRRDFAFPAPVFLKAGVKYEVNRRSFNRDNGRHVFAGEDGVPGAGDLGRFQDTRYRYGPMNGRYAPLPFPGVPNRGGSFDVKRVLQTHPELFTEDVFFRVSENLLWDRDLRESIGAAYAMGGIERRRLSVLAGLRAEETRVSGTGALNLITPEERARRASYSGNLAQDAAEQGRRAQEQFGRRQTLRDGYLHLFPSVHFTYEAGSNLQARAAYTTAIGRPPVGNIVPNDTIDLETRTITSGNPGLRPQYSDNFDASVEHYFEPAGLLSIALFQKNIRDFVYTDVSTIAPGGEPGFGSEYAGFSLRRPRNGGFARVRGAEIHYQQQFSFLPGRLAGLGVYANYAWVGTRGNYGSGALRSTGEVNNFVPESGNAGISYQLSGVAAALHVTHVGEYLTFFSADVSQRHYRYARTTVELKTKFALNRRLDFYFDIYNLFDEPVRPTFFGKGFRHVGNSNREGVQFATGISGRF